MRRPLLLLPAALGLFALASLLAGGILLPPLLLHPPLPVRTEPERARIRAELRPPGATWAPLAVAGGEGRALEVWRLRRRDSRGVAVLLHGFGDDAWGTAPRLRDLPDRARLEAEGPPLAGALLESPWRDLADAARDHLRGTLGSWELLCRPAEWVALARAGRLARFQARAVSPLRACRGLRTPIALLAGDRDTVTPISGVRDLARFHPDLTVVPGAGHLQAARDLPGGWAAWARVRLARWECQ